MNIYRISQIANNDYGTYDSAIVAAPNEKQASQTLPDGTFDWNHKYSWWCSSPDQVTVQLIGRALSGTEPGVILASYNAG
jgi:hypothetical protein